VTAGVSELPHTGAALVLVPVGLALLAGGAALRRKMAA
jgi:LPXTG-motif cell wall-anchored protein